jgi:site-specific DNA-cytosine methylase
MIDGWKGFEKPLENIKWPEDKIGTLTTHVAKMSNGIKLVRDAKDEKSIKRVWWMYGQTTRWWIYDTDWVSPTITASMWMWGWHVPMINVVDWEVRVRQATKKWYIVANDWDGISLSYPNSTTRRGRVVKWKSNTLTTQWEAYVLQKVWDRDKNNFGVHTDKSYCLPANPMSDRWQVVVVPCATQIWQSKNWGNSYGSDKAYTLRSCNPNWVIENIWVVRKLTPVECERLQTLEDWYTEWVSDSQRYKMLGNWWTCDVIAHIFSFLPKE